MHHVSALNSILADRPVGPLLRNVIAASPSDPAIERALLDQWITPRQAVAVTLREAVQSGELPADVAVEVAVDALVSPPYYRLMFGMAPLDEDAVIRLVQTVWQGCRATYSAETAFRQLVREVACRNAISAESELSRQPEPGCRCRRTD